VTLRRDTPLIAFWAYAARWIGFVLCMEVSLHYLYGFTLVANPANVWIWERMSLCELVTSSVWVLLAMWLKFVVLWKFFRLWGLIDGIEAPENMRNFLYCNISVFEFWRNWHASFNLWIVRYIYIPLGGSKGSKSNRFCNILIVFFFVGVWHSFTWNMLIWASFVCLCILPEFCITNLITGQHPIRKHPAWKYMTIMGGACNAILLTTANLVGFHFGAEGVLHSLKSIKTKELLGTCFLVAAFWLSWVSLVILFRPADNWQQQQQAANNNDTNTSNALLTSQEASQQSQC